MSHINTDEFKLKPVIVEDRYNQPISRHEGFLIENQWDLMSYAYHKGVNQQIWSKILSELQQGNSVIFNTMGGWSVPDECYFVIN